MTKIVKGTHGYSPLNHLSLPPPSLNCEYNSNYQEDPPTTTVNIAIYHKTADVAELRYFRKIKDSEIYKHTSAILTYE